MQIREFGRLAGLSYAEATTHIERAWSSSTVGTRSQRSPDGASPGRVASSAAGTSATKPATAEKAAEFLAPNGAGGGSPNGARGGAPHAEPGFSTPRVGTRLPFGTPPVAGAPLLGSPGSGPKGPWENLAQGGAVDSSSAPVTAEAGERSPPREEVSLQILELMKDFREQMKASPPPEGVKSMTADEISALTQRGGSPLAGLEFKQTLPTVKTRTWISIAIFENFGVSWTVTP